MEIYKIASITHKTHKMVLMLQLHSHVHALLGLLDAFLDLRCNAEVQFLGHRQSHSGGLHHLQLPPVTKYGGEK